MQFNIYNLGNNDSTIRVIWGDKLKKNLINSLRSLKKEDVKYKEIAISSEIDYTTLRKYFKRPSIPLRFFKSLKENYNIDLSKYFLYLESTNLRKWEILNKEKKGLNTIWKLNQNLEDINVYRRY